MLLASKVLVTCGILLQLSLAPLASADRPREPALQAVLEEGSCSAAVQQSTWQNQCQYAKEHCTEDAVIPYHTLFFCHAKAYGWVGASFYLAACLFWLLLLFCILGSTSEEFFSPILSQISQEMGLPPRFAGVTLLALGNGAPDLSACIAAVSSGRYRLALGALLGGAMFVGCVVAGSVIVASGGVPARGALMRDMASVIIAISFIGLILASGAVTWLRAGILLALYLTYVVVVLVADLLHRHPWRPWHGWGASDDTADLQVGLLHGSQARQQPSAGRSPWTSETGDTAFQPGVHPLPGDDCTRSTSTSSIELQHTASPEHQLQQHHLSTARAGSWSLEGLAGHLQRPTTVIHPGQHTRLSEAGPHPAHAHPPRVSRVLAHYAEERGRKPHHGTEHMSSADSLPAGLPWADLHPLAPSPLQLHQSDPGPGPHSPSLRDHAEEVGSIHSSLHGDEESQAVTESAESELDPWLQHVPAPLLMAWDAVGRALSMTEMPIWALRRASIPLLEAECYSRPWFVLSMIGAPLAVLIYLRLFSIIWLAAALTMGVSSALLMAFLTRDDPEVSPPLSLGTSMPIGAAIIAGCGFIVAAMWIDSVASEVVALLDLLGTVSGVDHTVLGLTVLAWGNSLGDLSTNVAMARRGLANMAMTACYAGPMFSMLVGLGIGFMTLLAGRSLPAFPVTLSPMVFAGIIFLLATSSSLLVTGILLKARLPARFGILLLCLYAAYLITSISLALAGAR
ncbi:hypothetical protein WJX74_010576 [Apatococcus lobatus]|uniref:Sodium/calcium exchanger membrane region domain-containing protein n=1 Tax=Apatococcus lobatus TaxID=904363 RepID=A0AAW1QIP7_9CHLO